MGEKDNNSASNNPFLNGQAANSIAKLEGKSKSNSIHFTKTSNKSYFTNSPSNPFASLVNQSSQHSQGSGTFISNLENYSIELRPFFIDVLLIILTIAVVFVSLILLRKWHKH